MSGPGGLPRDHCLESPGVFLIRGHNRPGAPADRWPADRSAAAPRDHAQRCADGGERPRRLRLQWLCRPFGSDGWPVLGRRRGGPRAHRRRALKFTSLAAELVEVGAVGKVGHDTSPPEPGPAFRARTKMACRRAKPCEKRRWTQSFPRTRRCPRAPFATVPRRERPPLWVPRAWLIEVSPAVRARRARSSWSRRGHRGPP